ncbi:hypothetical protein F5883DRAFT_77532 [Diaporthe sp. PMI_573]|nr:hypothetical protein F5883DRAFT_77532 [Diaporthaceae sp. PMI_573]
MDHSTRDRICSRSWMDGQVAVEINWTGPVPSHLSVSHVRSSQARSDQTPMLLLLHALLACCHSHRYRQKAAAESRKSHLLLSAPDGSLTRLGQERRTHRNRSPGEQAQSLASDNVPARADRTQQALVVQIWSKLRVSQLGRRTGSNTTRSRLVALRSVPFTRIPGLLARGWANEVRCSLTVVQAQALESRWTGSFLGGLWVAHEDGRILSWAEQGRRMQHLNLKRGGLRPSLPCT